MLAYPGGGGVARRLIFDLGFHLQPYFVHERVAKALASLYLCFDLHEPLLIDTGISTKISCAVSFNLFSLQR